MEAELFQKMQNAECIMQNKRIDTFCIMHSEFSIIIRPSAAYTAPGAPIPAGAVSASPRRSAP